MTTMDTQQDRRGEGVRETETPQAADGNTRTVSTEVCTDFALLDTRLSKALPGEVIFVSKDIYNCVKRNHGI